MSKKAPKDVRIEFRCSPDEKLIWEEAAYVDNDDQSVAQWIRKTLNTEAKSLLARVKSREKDNQKK